MKYGILGKGLTLISCGFLVAACSSTTADDDDDNGENASQAVAIQPTQGTAQNITLQVYSDGWGNLLETKTMATEGSVTIDVAETQPYYDPPKYYVYATAAGFYTELYSCTKGGSIDVDLDAVPNVSSAIAGTIFARQGFFADSYTSSQSIAVSGPDGFQATIQTDSQGRYGIQQLPLGNYTFTFDYVQFEESAATISLPVNNTTEQVDYQDLSFDEPAQAS